ncbi:MAG: MarR family transcriptional regulator [Bradyrhizobium sp.]
MVRPKQKPQKRQKAAAAKPAKGMPRRAVSYEALAQFRYRLRLFLAFSDTNAKKAGLTSQQYQALLAIKGFAQERPMFVGELAHYLLIKHHTAVELVDRMVKLKLLRRTTDAVDNRRVLVTLTKRGQLRLQKVAATNFKHLGSSSRMLHKISKLLGSV